MTDALIGYSGFIGSVLRRARTFDAVYRSTDIDTIRGASFDTVICCGAPAEKWKANMNPEGDRANLRTLTDALATVRAARLVLISSVDVYPQPCGVDETTPIDPTALHPYGRHRLELEQFCLDRFETIVVRLPGLYGHGLKKNAVFDLLHDRAVDAIPGNARFQFYDTDRLWSDIQRVAATNLTLVNITAEPIDMNTVAARVFGRSLPTAFADGAPSYDIRSVHAGLVGGRDGYWFDAETEISGLQRFVQDQRAQ